MNTDNFSKSRIEAFSDGVFAIIVTLLVLEIKVPHISDGTSAVLLTDQLIHLVPKFVGWLISFLTVCVIWVNHHRIFIRLGVVNHRLFWINALLLLFVSFIPFPTALMGDYPGNSLAVLLYGTVMFLMALAFYLMRRAVLSDGAAMHPSIASPDFALATRAALYWGVLPYGVATGIAVFLPLAAICIYLLIPIYFALPRAAQRQ